MKCIFVSAMIALMSFSVSEVVAAETNVISRVETVVSKKPKKNLSKVVYTAHIHCESCVTKIKENISFERGVKGLEVSLKEQTISIIFDSNKTTEDKLVAALNKIGYKVKKVETKKKK